MRTILSLIQKEFIQIFRNKIMIPIIFVMPVVQLVVLVYAANLEMKSINIQVVDNDNSTLSRQLASKFEASPFFILSKSNSLKNAQNKIKSDNADIVMNIPINFEKKLLKENASDIQLLFNAINGTKASVASVYCREIIFDFNKDIILKLKNVQTEIPNFKNINVINAFWYNPQLDYKVYMSSGILVVLITIVSMFLSSMNLVREKEIGTIEQINVSPIKKHHFIAGKLIPFLIIALFELAFGLLIAHFLFNLQVVGSLLLLFFVASIFLITTLGIGLFISTTTNTQQQAMFISFFFYLVFILMSGIFTPTESMPYWAQKINYLNPMAWFMKILRMILMKGSGFYDIKNDLFILMAYGFSTLSMAVWKYKKTK